MKKEKLGTIGLTAVILSAIIGGGVYDLPKNMADSAANLGQILAWLITGIGMWFITSMFMQLSQLKPNLTTGLYKYGEQGFGKFTGFFVSWGYWICQCFNNAAYAVLLMNTLNFFFPGKFVGGNNWLSIFVASIFLWIMSFIIISGIRNTNNVEIVATICTFIAIVIFIITMACHFKWGIFIEHGFVVNNKQFGSLTKQISKSLMVTLWVFGGIEGAVVLSKRAKSQKNVIKATLLGFATCLIIYVLISLLPLGAFSINKVAKIASPSMASLLSLAWNSQWGKITISIALLITVFAGWLTWTLILSEMPYAAAKDNAFPSIFAKENMKQTPVVSLIISTLIIQVILFFVRLSNNAFETMYSYVATLTIPPYLISALYLFKLSQTELTGKLKNKAMITGFMAIIYTLIMIYSAGINYLTMAFIIYMLGIPVYVWNQIEKKADKVFTKNELYFVSFIVVIAIIGIYLLIK